MDPSQWQPKSCFCEGCSTNPFENGFDLGFLSRTHSSNSIGLMGFTPLTSQTQMGRARREIVIVVIAEFNSQPGHFSCSCFGKC